MNLMPKDISEKLCLYPLCSQDGKGMDADVVVKYFNPYGAGTWLITEGELQPDGDWLLFGYCHIFEWEWGYVLLSELQNPELNIERDLYSKGTVREHLKGVK